MIYLCIIKNNSYFHAMESLILETGISTNDLLVISSIVDQNPEVSIFNLQKTLIRVFGKNIKPVHYLVLGYLIGYVVATEKAHDDFFKHNAICQRQN
jgi:hypothetical protein